MKEYEVTIIETLERIVKVTASHKDEAILKVMEDYKDFAIVLDASDFTGVDFTAKEREDK